jgi:hypothetical protein
MLQYIGSKIYFNQGLQKMVKSFAIDCGVAIWIVWSVQIATSPRIIIITTHLIAV